MILISANPTKTKRRKSAASPKGATVKKHRTAAQKAATKRLVSMNKKRHHNPTKRKYHAVSRKRRSITVNPKRRRRMHRNPSGLGGFGGSALKEMFSKEGAMMIGAAMLAPMVADYAQEKLMPTATGWTRIAVKAAVIAAGVYALQRFLKKPKVALAFGVTGAAVLASDAVNLFHLSSATGTSAKLADAMSQDPALADAIVQGYYPTLADSEYLGESSYYPVLSDPYGEAFNPSFG
jgi:hypothetical protein